MTETESVKTYYGKYSGTEIDELLTKIEEFDTTTVAKEPEVITTAELEEILV